MFKCNETYMFNPNLTKPLQFKAIPMSNLNDDNTISVDEAIARVQTYRTHVAPLYPEGNEPRAIFIPIADVQGILDRFNNSPEANDGQLSGIRVYFSMLTNDPEDLNVHGLVVPVREDGTDIIIPTGEGDSSIYDFTRPCPTTCDLSSVLFEA